MFLPFETPDPQEWPFRPDDAPSQPERRDGFLMDPPAVIPATPLQRTPRKVGLLATVADNRTLGQFLRVSLQASGLSVNEMAKRMVIDASSLRQYLSGKRATPSLRWFLRFIELSGGKVWVEYPTTGQRPDQG